MTGAVANPKDNRDCLYAGGLTPAEKQAVNREASLLCEVSLLRAFVLRLAVMLSGREDYSKEDRALLAQLTRLCTSIGDLLTQQTVLSRRSVDVQSVISEALVSQAPLVFPTLLGGKR